MPAFEIWEDPSAQVRFCFSHSDSQFTTGVMIIQPGALLPKHNRPLAFENLLQISGNCKMTLLDESGSVETEYILSQADYLRMEKGQWHIHANPYPEESVTLFKAVGDISSIVSVLRETFTEIPLKSK